GRRSPRRRRPRPLRLHPLPSPGPAPVRRRDPQGVSRPAHLGGRARLRPRARRLARRDGPRPAGRPQPGGGVMLALTIAFRFLRSQPGQTALIIAGIGVGIAVQIFVGSLITSLQDDLVDSTVGSSAHITLLPEDDGEQISGDLAEEALRQPEVTTAIPVRRMSGLYVSGDQSTPLSITGGDPEDIDSVYGLSERIVDGEFALEDGQILVGTTFAEGAATGIGDELELVLPNGEPASFTVAGIFDLGAAAANERLAFVDAGSVGDALGLGDDEYSAIEIQVADVFTSTEVAQRLESPGVEVVDWQAENQELLSGLAAQSGSSLMIQAFVLVAVAL